MNQVPTTSNEHRKVIALDEFRQRISSENDHPPPPPRPAAAARRPVPPDRVDAFGWTTLMPRPTVFAA
jgi:hypothetical protein